MECTEIADTILMDAGTVDASMYNAIQQKIFNATCTACHGLSATPGGGLNLLEGHSHADLVNRASTTVDGKMRLCPAMRQKVSCISYWVRTSARIGV